MQEIFENVVRRLKEEVTLLENELQEAKEYDDEQIIFAVNNQLRAFNYALRVIEEDRR